MGISDHLTCLLIYVEYIMQNTGTNINNLRYTDDTTLMGESKEELKSL